MSKMADVGLWIVRPVIRLLSVLLPAPRARHAASLAFGQCAKPVDNPHLLSQGIAQILTIRKNNAYLAPSPHHAMGERINREYIMKFKTLFATALLASTVLGATL